jgi:hypothetical protein
MQDESGKLQTFQFHRLEITIDIGEQLAWQKLIFAMGSERVPTCTSSGVVHRLADID